MQKKLIIILPLAVCIVALGVRNHALGVALAAKEAALAAKEAELAAVQMTAGDTNERTNVPQQVPTGQADDAHGEGEDDIAGEENIEQEVETRVQQRLEAIQREREQEREARRREWENMTDEERDEKRREFQSRMVEFSTKKLDEFVEKTGLDEGQRLAFEDELGALDARMREIVQDFADYVEEGGNFGFEEQLLMVSESSAALLDAYAGLDDVLPEGWREKDCDFNVMFGIGPDAINPLMDALRKKGGADAWIRAWNDGNTASATPEARS